MVLQANGVDQGELKTFLDLIRTNWAGILAKLDADTGVPETDYASLWALPAHKVQNNGMEQGDLLDWLNTVMTNFNGVLVKLDADTLGYSNYNSTLAITDVIDNPLAGNLKKDGMNLGNLVKLLSTILVQVNALNAKLDLDSVVNNTNYAALWNISTALVDATRCTN